MINAKEGCGRSARSMPGRSEDTPCPEEENTPNDAQARAQQVHTECAQVNKRPLRLHSLRGGTAARPHIPKSKSTRPPSRSGGRTSAQSAARTPN
eukprot:7506963-Alexandrium_andersonii.AAC.1